MKRARSILPRLLGSAALTAGLVAAVTAFAGLGSAQTNAAQAEYSPENTKAPSISGSTVVGQTLTANAGTWNSSSTPSYAYQWTRCDTAGNNCADIGGATSQGYVLQKDDTGHTIRVKVTAKNTSGSTTATSAQTQAVTATAPPPPPPSNAKNIAAANVTLPNRLTVDNVKFEPRVLTSRAPFVVRFHVKDENGKSVQGALVYTLGLPYGWTRNGAEAPTDATGWTSITITPTRSMPVTRGHALVMFVRARVQGQNLLSGASTRRLVQVRIR